MLISNFILENLESYLKYVTFGFFIISLIFDETALWLQWQQRKVFPQALVRHLLPTYK